MDECPRYPNGEYNCQVDYPTSDTYCCKLWINRRRTNVSRNAESSHPEYFKEHVNKLDDMDRKLTQIYNKMKLSNPKGKEPVKEENVVKEKTKKRLYNYGQQ